MQQNDPKKRLEIYIEYLRTKIQKKNPYATFEASFTFNDLAKKYKMTPSRVYAIRDKVQEDLLTSGFYENAEDFFSKRKDLTLEDIQPLINLWKEMINEPAPREK